MRYLLLLSITFLLSSFLFISCSKSDDPAPMGSATANADDVSSECSDNITYSNHIKPLVMKTCAVSGCHTPNGFKDFTSYSSLKSHIESGGVANFIARIEPGGGMPPSYSSGPNLTDCERVQLKTWLQAGYLNN